MDIPITALTNWNEQSDITSHTTINKESKLSWDGSAQSTTVYVMPQHKKR